MKDVFSTFPICNLQQTKQNEMRKKPKTSGFIRREMPRNLYEMAATIRSEANCAEFLVFSWMLVFNVSLKTSFDCKQRVVGGTIIPTTSYHCQNLKHHKLNSDINKTFLMILIHLSMIAPNNAQWSVKATLRNKISATPIKINLSLKYTPKRVAAWSASYTISIEHQE